MNRAHIQKAIEFGKNKQTQPEMTTQIIASLPTLSHNVSTFLWKLLNSF